MTRATTAARFIKFEGYLRALLRRDEIMQKMGISRSTYYAWLQKSEREAARYFEDLAKASYPLYFKRTIEGWEDQIKVLEEIRKEAKNPMAKIQATALIGEFIGAIQAAVNRGPSVLSIIESQKRQDEVEKLRKESR